MDTPTTAIIVGASTAIVAGLIGYLFALIRRRSEGSSQSSESLIAEARLEAQRTLSAAEQEARAKAEAYRDREDVTLEQRRIEADDFKAQIA